MGLRTQYADRPRMKVPTFDGHLNESNTDLRRCSMEYTPRRKLTREFKLEAVRQVALSEKSKAQLVRELGVRVGQLRTWRLEFEKEASRGHHVLCFLSYFEVLA